MADQTVTSPASKPQSDTGQAKRLEMANEALHEVHQIADALRSFIADRDTVGDVVYVARGMLTRVIDLAGAISNCIEPDAFERGGREEAVFALINAGGQVTSSQLRGADHG